jgi:hypothetical protein
LKPLGSILHYLSTAAARLSLWQVGRASMTVRQGHIEGSVCCIAAGRTFERRLGF